MKKLFLLLLLLPLWGSLYAVNCVSVHSVSANYATKAVTFTLTWSGCNNTNHLNKAWVFVDYQTITGITRGAWAPATIVGTPAVSNGTYAAGNSRGFYVTGVNGQTATVTVTLGNVPAQFNWCAYATDYPPNVTAIGGTYTLHGTAPFTLIAADGVSTQVVNGKSIAASALTVAPITIRDATGCPGIFCPYTGTDLFVDATHICQQRTTGAQNWEAWIKDTRDNNLYRVVQFSDNSWWFADYLATSNNRVGMCAEESYYASPNLPACPEGWRIPLFAEVQNRWPVNVSGVNWKVQDPYGAPFSRGYFFHTTSTGCGGGYGCHGANTGIIRYDLIVYDAIGAVGTTEDKWDGNCEFAVPQSIPSAATIAGRVRCTK